MNYRFHIRHGNAIVFQDPPDLDTDGLEWKVLPSGAHTISRDVMYVYVLWVLIQATFHMAMT